MAHSPTGSLLSSLAPFYRRNGRRERLERIPPKMSTAPAAMPTSAAPTSNAIPAKARIPMSSAKRAMPTGPSRITLIRVLLGVPGKPARFMSGEPFHRCTHTALSPKEEIYVSDGYGNARVHKYSPDGKLLMSWGEPGTGEGEFNIVHNIGCDADGWVYVADRENHRVQVFDGNGKYETQWKNLHRPCGLYMPYGHQPICYIGEVGPSAAVSRDIPNLGPRVSIVDHEGKLIGRFGDTPAGTELGKFLAPHGLEVDSRGDIYVGEVSWSAWPQIYPGKPHPADLRSLQKFEKVE